MGSPTITVIEVLLDDDVLGKDWVYAIDAFDDWKKLFTEAR